jgi:ActR/RegA family two-component response regulator
MTTVSQALSELVSHLRRLNVRWALVGGMAVSARAEPRFTRDVDVAISVEDDNTAETIVRALAAAGFTVLTIVEQEAASRLSTVRLAPPGGDEHGVIVDLLFASSGIEREIVDCAEEIELLEGLVVPLARTGHLIALKVLSNDPVQRPQDAQDIASLLQHAEPAELRRAREALATISRRGFDRKRDLLSLFEDTLSERTTSP